MSKKERKILVIDDEEKIVEVLKAYLEKEGYAVYFAYNGKDALSKFESISPSIILLDLMLPDISGEEVCKMIRRKSRVPIIMLTAKSSEESMLDGLAFGADDYIIKPFSPKEVIARISAVLRRTETDELVEDIITFNNGYLSIDYKSYTVKVDGTSVDLTPTEYKILSTMSKSPNKSYTRDQLINFALDGEFMGYGRSIDTYIKNLRQKIEINPKSPKIILTVHGVGYRFGGE